MPARLQLGFDDKTWTAQLAGDVVSLDPGSESVSVRSDAGRLSARVGTNELRGYSAAAGDTVWVSVNGEVFVVLVRHGARERTGTREHDALTPPMSATVVRIGVKPGDRVRDGDVLIALEAMKMELPIRAPRDGVVRAVHCSEGDLVQPEQVLLELD